MRDKIACWLANTILWAISSKSYYRFTQAVYRLGVVEYGRIAEEWRAKNA